MLDYLIQHGWQFYCSVYYSTILECQSKDFKNGWLKIQLCLRHHIGLFSQAWYRLDINHFWSHWIATIRINPSHNLNVRTLFRWIFWLRNQGYFTNFHSTLMMACCGSIKSLSYLRVPQCMYQVHTYANYPNVNIYTTKDLHVSHQVLVLHEFYYTWGLKRGHSIH